VAKEHILQKTALTISDFCSEFGVGRSFVYTQFKKGSLKYRKAGKRTIITHDAAMEWLANLPEGGSNEKT